MHRSFSLLFPSPQAFLCLRHNNVEIRPTNIFYSDQVKESVNLNQKLEMINTENPDRSKSRLNNEVLYTKEKFLKEVKYCCTREHTNDKRVKSLTADREKVLVV